MIPAAHLESMKNALTARAAVAEVPVNGIGIGRTTAPPSPVRGADHFGVRPAVAGDPKLVGIT